MPVSARHSPRAIIPAVIFVVSATTYLAYVTAPQHLRPSAPFKFTLVHHEKKQISKYVDTSTKNRTTDDIRLLVYNRVSKCGSTTMQTLLKKLASINQFKHESSTVYALRQLTEEQQLHYVQSLQNEMVAISKPFSTDRHFYYIDFTKFDIERPIYFNMIREPVQRIVSSFYYLRSPARWERMMKGKKIISSHENVRIPRDVRRRPAREGGSKSYYRNLLLAGLRRELASSKWANKNFTNCVLLGEKECFFASGHSRETIVSFFCGSDPQCLIINNEEALQRAKYNLETAYSVVGIVEEFEASLAVLEHYIPLYFRGATTAYTHMRSEWQQRNKTPHPSPTPEVLEALRQNLTADIDFYHFAKQRLHKQLKFLKLNITSTAINNIA